MATVETAKVGTSVIANTQKYSEIAMQYGRQFASFWGCSEEKAKALLSNQTFVNIARRIKQEFSPYFITMNTHQIATFCKQLTNKKRAEDALALLSKGVSIQEVQQALMSGEQALTELTEKVTANQRLSLTKPLFNQFNKVQNGRTLAMA